MTSDITEIDVEAPIGHAKGVMAAHLAALNARDTVALTATMHFPHYRLSSGRMKIWPGPENYLADFYVRAGDTWHHTYWESLEVFAAVPNKVHLDVRFARCREDDSVIGRFRALWVIAELDGVWGAQLRSSFAP